MKREWILIGLVSVIVMGWACVHEGEASRPVSKTMTGCVVGGNFYSVGDRLPGEGKRSLVVYRITVRDMNLAPYEGKKIRVQGRLLPGDRFTPDPSTLSVLGPCDNASSKAIRERSL